jgi:hypothetical protein
MTPETRRIWPWNWTRPAPPKPRRRPARRHATPATLERLDDRTLPSTFAPTSFTDSFDVSAPSNKPISLRDAIIDANNDTGTATDTIVLQSGTYNLTLANPSGPRQDFLSHAGELDITNTHHVLIIKGAGSSGSGATIVDATALADRAFHLVGPGVQVMFQNLEIRGGTARDDGTLGTPPDKSTATGGGILDDAGTLTLTNAVITGAKATAGSGLGAAGGGVFVGGGTARLTGTTLSHDSATGASGANAAFTSNAGDGGAGGVGQGGGLFAGVGTLSLTGDTFRGDIATGGAGGAGGIAIHAGFSGGAGGAGGAGQGGGLFTSGGTLSFSNDTFRSDTATGGNGGNGGSDSSASGAGGNGGVGQGGGFFAQAPTSVSLSTLTFTADQALGSTGGTGNPEGTRGLGSNKDGLIVP